MCSHPLIKPKKKQLFLAGTYKFVDIDSLIYHVTAIRKVSAHSKT